MSENETLYDSGDTGTQEGDSWTGGFPAELEPELRELGFDNPKDDLGEEGMKGFAQLRGDWGGDFVGNMQAIRETLELLPENVQQKFKKNPRLLNSPDFLKAVGKALKDLQTGKEMNDERRKGDLKFAGMEEVQRAKDLRAIQDRVDFLWFKHESKFNSEIVKRGKPW